MEGSITEDHYFNLVAARQRAEKITSILYIKNDTCSEEEQELIIKQQYFFCSATVRDIRKRYVRNISERGFDKFPEKVAIQINDAYPAIAIVELLRILLDDEGLNIHQAWLIASKTFSYTCHSVSGNIFLEKWPVELVGKILPRHLEIMHVINYFFMEQIRDKH
mmetsp:Transcript_19361/g.14025  ORF Transcript_19361/g.14025 Transcript_19361/m.14025 type:complete len:164 (+) Transcript_19361:1038-1529(+)